MRTTQTPDTVLRSFYSLNSKMTNIVQVPRYESNRTHLAKLRQRDKQDREISMKDSFDRISTIPPQPSFMGAEKLQKKKGRDTSGLCE